jgi:chromosome segregation ATPase
MIVKVETERKESLADITEDGKRSQTQVNECKKVIDGLNDTLKELDEVHEKANIEYLDATKYKDKRLDELDAIIEENPTKKPEEDENWIEISRQIAGATLEIGEPAGEQLSGIEVDRTRANDKLITVNESLAQVDRMKKDGKRIEELEDQEKDLAQKLADIEKQLEDIANYNAKFSALIEKSVNGKFKHVTFKMFNKLLNGSLETCCEAMLNGVTYPDMSAGQKIFIGIDIVNVLSKHYDMSVPLFIDGAESLTLPIEADCQTIELHAVKDFDELIVELK